MEITEKEWGKIVKALNNHDGGDHYIDENGDLLGSDCFEGRFAIIRNYTSDCPSWTGDIAFVIGGEECFKTILYRDSGTEDWYVKETMHEGEYEEFSNE
jgi:hypothetical protein